MISWTITHIITRGHENPPTLYVYVNNMGGFGLSWTRAERQRRRSVGIIVLDPGFFPTYER